MHWLRGMMKQAAGVIFTLLIGCKSVGPAPCLQTPPLRIVCIGDSLTVCGGPGGRYTDYLAAWLDGHEVVNKGIYGDTLGGGRKRYEQDVLALNPDIVIIELGANDFWQARRPIDGLAADLEYMTAAARNAGAQVVIASCFGDADGSSPEFQSPIQPRYAAGIARFERDIAVRYDAFYVPNMQADIKPNTRTEYWGDDNHPNKTGNEFVARRIWIELQKALERTRAQPE